ncbi:MAG: glyoxylate/hydroxypyruvate reductase A [Spirochaetaceae bacterium]|nr:MAG: glyoxylate/hydroxypyruvate reductase A [Spirochaetaceae bacterium]
MSELHLILNTPEDRDRWARALQRELPAVRIHADDREQPCDYALLWQPPEDVISHAHSLKAIIALGAGVDSILKLPGLPEGVPLVRIEDSGMAAEMAEYGVYAVLQEFRQFRWYEAEQRKRRWSPRPRQSHESCPVGVLGLGVLGERTAGLIASLGFPVYGWSRTPREIAGVRCRSGEEGLVEVLSESRVLIVLLPLTAETRGLLDAKRLELLPRGATLVNLARGPLVRENDLLQALDSGHVGHAFLDVFETEPLPVEHPLWTHRNVTVTPHIAAQATVESMAEQVAAKIRSLEAGNPVTGVVDRARGY